MKSRAIVLVTFGSSYEEAIKLNLDPLKADIASEFPDAEVRLAMTSRFIRKIWKDRGRHVADLRETLENLRDEGYKNIFLQPTHLLYGHEYHRIEKWTKEARDWGCFDKLELGTPMLGSNEDYMKISHILTEIYPEKWGDKEGSVVLMGHGTSHWVNSIYPALNFILDDIGAHKTHIGTVEGYPDIDYVIRSLKKSGATQVYLAPFMIMAGDHVNNDMIGDEEDSWLNQLKSEGFDVEYCGKGLGEYPQIRNIYVNHIKELWES